MVNEEAAGILVETQGFSDKEHPVILTSVS